jgi:hypothetical protein
LSGGQLQKNESADVGLLLELGALDRYEELANEEPKVLVFAEDEKTKKLETLLKSNGWDLEKCEFVSFNGVDNFEATRVVIDYFISLNAQSRVLVYRDGDGMTRAERDWARLRYEAILPERSSIYISELTDVEHVFCRPKHVARICDIEEDEAEQIVQRAIDENQAKLASKLTRKRDDLKFKILKSCPNRASIEDVIGDEVSFDFSLGKLLLPMVEKIVRDSGYALDTLIAESDSLIIDELRDFEMP